MPEYGLSLTGIVYSALIREYGGPRKPVLWHIVCSVINLGKNYSFSIAGNKPIF